MNIKNLFASSGAAMALFILLWGSAAIFTRWGLDNTSVFVLLIWRYAIALFALTLLAFIGLMLIVSKGLNTNGLSTLGLWYAGGALLCITIGTLMQKRIKQAPQQILPLQYAITLIMCLAFLPTEEIRNTFNFGFWVPALWLGLIISVVAQLLLYKLIRTGNVVNITSLFYLVPVVTAILDYIILGNAMSTITILGMFSIIAGIILVFRKS